MAAKIMLVEDDNSLREIYEARLAAEGYTIVTAKDGEEALALALKERPDLIIADVMMPKVSGFDMLDILRSTPETKNTKIIMMTALSQAEDKARAEKLGADRYLVKSQVTLEDVTREAHTILAELESQAAATVAQVETPAVPTPAAAPAPTPVAPATPAPVPSPSPKPATAPEPPAEPTPSPKPTVTSIPVTAAPDDDDTTDTDTTEDKKLAKEAAALSEPVKEEKAEVKEQVDEFIASNPTLSTSPEADKASAAVNSLTKAAGADTAPKDSEESTRAYVNNNEGEDKPGNSLEHTKTIQPTAEALSGETHPDLDALLAKEGESASSETSPAVNSIIAPNDTSGTPPAI
jgi:CheY-like chemotaxis protein